MRILTVTGWQLGSDSIVQVPNNVSNHLTAGLLKYLETTGRYASGINLFEKLRTQNIEVSSLLAKVLFMANEEVQGVRILHQALKESPMDYVMLDTQAEFLLKKALSPSATPEQKEERLRMALGCADRSTIAAPSEFGTWARLAQVYVAMEDWENALTILNSCPMFTYQDKDAPAMPEPKDVYLPTLPETRLDEIDSEPEARYAEQVDPSLLNLRAALYKGTFKHAYGILTEMAQKIGWDQLLKIRSTVFVMEDEYRTEKSEATQPAQAPRNASTDGLRGTPDPATNGDHPASDLDGSSQGLEEPIATVDAENDAAVEKPTHAIDPGEVKADPDAVRQAQIHPPKVAPEVTDRIFSRIRTTSIFPSLTTKGCARDGSTASSWFCTKICACTRSGAHRWPSLGLSPCSTASRQKNGRFWGRWRSASNTLTRQQRRSPPAWPPGSVPRHCREYSAFTRRARTQGKLLGPRSD